MVIDSEIDAIPDTEHEVQMQPEEECFEDDSQAQVSQDTQAGEMQDMPETQDAQDAQDAQETRPKQSQEDPEQSQEDPEQSQEDPSQTQPSQQILHLVGHPTKTPIVGGESAISQWPHHYDIQVREELVDSENFESLTVEQVDDQGNKYYVVSDDVVKQLQQVNPKESPAKRRQKKKSEEEINRLWLKIVTDVIINSCCI